MVVVCWVNDIHSTLERLFSRNGNVIISQFMRQQTGGKKEHERMARFMSHFFIVAIEFQIDKIANLIDDSK